MQLRFWDRFKRPRRPSDETPAPPAEQQVQTISNVVGVEGSLDLAVTYARERPWFDTWREALAARDAIEAMYNGTNKPRDSDACKRAVVHFCDACYEVKDHLKTDAAAPVSSSNVEDFVHNKSSYLWVVGDVSNTDKH